MTSTTVARTRKPVDQSAAIVKRLAAFVGKTNEASQSAREDILALSYGVTSADFNERVVEKIGHMRLGRVMRVVDRVAIVKAWQAEDRPGGTLSTLECVAALGIGAGTVSRALNATEDGDEDGDEGGEKEPTTRTKKTRAEKYAVLLETFRKLNEKDEKLSAAEAKIVKEISAEATRVTKK